jgi:hypothetical protein
MWVVAAALSWQEKQAAEMGELTSVVAEAAVVTPVALKLKFDP